MKSRLSTLALAVGLLGPVVSFADAGWTCTLLCWSEAESAHGVLSHLCVNTDPSITNAFQSVLNQCDDWATQVTSDNGYSYDRDNRPQLTRNCIKN